MPVYNGARYLQEAIDSILAQTLTDFELLIVDDGSTDNSVELVAAYADKRIRHIQNPENIGIARTRNRALELASGQFIALMDCDDVSHRDRLRQQVDFMQANPAVALCGTWVRMLGAARQVLWRCPLGSDFIRGSMLFACPFGAPSVMLRKEHVQTLSQCFDSDFDSAEDYDLWERIAAQFPTVNIPRALLDYRIHPGQISDTHHSEQKDKAWRVQLRLLRQLQIEPDQHDKNTHLSIGLGYYRGESSLDIGAVGAWLERLYQANASLAVFPVQDFKRVLAARWYLANLAAVRQAKIGWRNYGSSYLSQAEPRPVRKRVRLVLEFVRQRLAGL